jgi:hypothetical protein
LDLRKCQYPIAFCRYDGEFVAEKPVHRSRRGLYTGPGGGLYTGPGGGLYPGPGGGLYIGPGGGLYTGPGGGLYTGPDDNPYRSNQPPIRHLVLHLRTHGIQECAGTLARAHPLQL